LYVINQAVNDLVKKGSTTYGAAQLLLEVAKTNKKIEAEELKRAKEKVDKYQNDTSDSMGVQMMMLSAQGTIQTALASDWIERIKNKQYELIREKLELSGSDAETPDPDSIGVQSATTAALRTYFDEHASKKAQHWQVIR